MFVLNNFPDLHEMVKYEELYEHSYYEEVQASCSISKTSKRLSLCKKLEVREYYATNKNYRGTARVFGLQDSTVREICKAAPPKKTYKERFVGIKVSKHFKGNKKGAGKPLSYSIEIDQEILVWLLEIMDLHLPISSLGLRKFIKSKSQPYFQEFKASKGLLQNLVNTTDLNYEDAHQLAKSSLNS